jgi:hypothetical protein
MITIKIIKGERGIGNLEIKDLGIIAIEIIGMNREIEEIEEIEKTETIIKMIIEMIIEKVIGTMVVEIREEITTIITRSTSRIQANYSIKNKPKTNKRNQLPYK